MNKTMLMGIILLVAIGGAGFVMTKRATGGIVATGKQLFKDSPSFAKAYQIFPGPLSDQAKLAMTGFMTKTESQMDGSVVVTMTATNTEYKNQQYTVKPGYSLYFIEKSLGDDSASENTDRFLPDDMAVLVDAQGYVVN
jgi:hypothetical protein